MKFILGQKKEMTQLFNDKGDVIPVTVIKAGPCPIVRVKTEDSKDGYNSVVIGLAGRKKLSKRELGQTKGLGNLQYLREFSIDKIGEFNKGDVISANSFMIGDKVKVVGVSKGKGFQGVIKRHGFHGQQATHGTKDQERAPGSIGATEPARVFPGMKMPGHMGAQQVTVKNLEIVKIDSANNELYIKGAVPGAKNGLLMISCDGELKFNQGEAEAKKEQVVEKSSAQEVVSGKDKMYTGEDKDKNKDKADKEKTEQKGQNSK